MTVNLIVGVLSVSAPKAIKVRRGVQTIDLVEVTVGDDTRSGFLINLWLPRGEQGRERTTGPTLRDHALQLRPRDVIVAARVALNSYQGTVLGQSLRKGLTSIDVLHRSSASSSHAGARFPNSQDQDRVERTIAWVLRYVPGPTFKTPRLPKTVQQRKEGRQLESLPDDTPLKM